MYRFMTVPCCHDTAKHAVMLAKKTSQIFAANYIRKITTALGRPTVSRNLNTTYTMTN